MSPSLPCWRRPALVAVLGAFLLTSAAACRPAPTGAGFPTAAAGVPAGPAEPLAAHDRHEHHPECGHAARRLDGHWAYFYRGHWEYRDAASGRWYAYPE